MKDLDLIFWNMCFIWKSNLPKYVEFRSNFHLLHFEANLILCNFCTHYCVEHI